jgi:hypothetical protein
MVRAASVLSICPVLPVSLLLANGLSMAALYLFYRLVERHFGDEIGRDALLLVLAFPGALFFCFPYTESLYFFAVTSLFWELDNERYFWPCVMSFLMPLTKAIGIFIALPLAWHLYERRKGWAHWLLLIAPVLGWAAYFGAMYAQTGNAFEGFEAQRAYPYSPSIKNMFNVPAFLTALASVGSLHGMMDSVLDRGCFLMFLGLLPFVYRLNRTWFWYVLPAGLVPALTSYFMSYRRYIMVLFPLFIVLAQLLARTKGRWLFWYYVILSAALQVWAVKQFTCFKWAG